MRVKKSALVAHGRHAAVRARHPGGCAMDGGVIVFVGPGLTSFEQLAACAGRLGVETAWIGYPYSRARRWRTRMFVRHVSTAHDRRSLAAALRRLGPERIIDIPTPEDVLAGVAGAARGGPVAPPPAAALEH